MLVWIEVIQIPELVLDTVWCAPRITKCSGSKVSLHMRFQPVLGLVVHHISNVILGTQQWLSRPGTDMIAGTPVVLVPLTNPAASVMVPVGSSLGKCDQQPVLHRYGVRRQEVVFQAQRKISEDGVLIPEGAICGYTSFDIECMGHPLTGERQAPHHMGDPGDSRSHFTPHRHYVPQQTW